ncbi:MAG TPA: DUF362 domain-containing protein [Proteobacteria bacterium]|nr:DUF362 domain-containing protein [Pseudomonadota bacterium]
MNTRRVYLATTAKYDSRIIADILRQGLTTLGLEGTVSRGDRVLLKPNLVIGKAPELAVTTHPEVLRATAMVLQDCGARLFLGDSPGFGALEKCLLKSGLQPVMRALAITTVSFEEPKKVALTNSLVAKEITLADRACDFDKLINLPKLKTHVMMGTTLAVKNLFGLVPGLRKLQWHLRAGHDRRLFARMLLDIYRQMPPTWSFLDGVVGMEGEGPTNGTPRNCGLLALSNGAPELDYQVEKWVGFPGLPPISQEALNLGILEKRIETVGPAAESYLEPAIKPARGTGQATFFGQRFWGKFFISKPKITISRCHLCQVCVIHCPAQAMKLMDRRIVIDYKRCIRCYCCQELCPYGAVLVR